MSKALDGDALYDLPDDTAPEIAPPKGRKRAVTKASKGRAISLGAVWEYHDDEDLQGGNFETTVTKKRSVAPKRSKSTKAPSKTLSGLWDTVSDAQRDDEPQSSQLTTPPDSGKKTKRRTASTASQSKAKKLKPFKNPTITKPSVVREKESEDNPPSSKPVSTHRGWTTTEDALKSNSNGIAKTTLDKLAAFRYKPSTALLCAEIPTDLPLQGVVALGQAQESILQHRIPEVGRSSSDYGPVPSFSSQLGGCLFEPSVLQSRGQLKKPEAHNPETIQLPGNEMVLDPNNETFFADALWNFGSSSHVPSSNNPVNPEVNEPQPDILQLHQHSLPDGSTHTNPDPSQAAGTAADFPSENSIPRASAHTDIFEPTSSEAMALRCLPDYIDADGHNQLVSERLGGEILPTQNRASVAYLFSEEAMEYEHDFVVTGFETEEEAAAPELSPGDNQNLDENSPCYPSSDHPQTRNRVTEVQVERSDVEYIEATSRNISKDFDSDEFDEGLDDSDLLGVVSDVIVPDTQFILKSNAGVKQGKLLERQQVDPVSAQDAFTACGVVDLTFETSSPGRAVENASPFPQSLSSKAEDDYPMDAEDEEMFRMPDLMTTGVIEKFQAPASLLYAFEDDLGSREVYDSSLQFSPPKARQAIISPQKVHTDKASTTGSPTHRLETDLLPLGEEEDWGFLRNNHAAEDAQAQKGAHVSPDQLQAAVDNSTERLERPSSHALQAPSHPQNSASTPGSTAQTDRSFIMRILDDSHEYQPLQPFARPEFPARTRDRSPITGVSAQTFLRVCFRIGEMFREGARCEALKQDAVIELFARVTFSSREPGTTKQHFQFADLFHDRPPFPNGVLANYKTSGLVESESKAFLGADEGTLARCLGRLKRDSKSATGWMMHIINIRITDWEEIRWTKRIVSAGLVKSEGHGLSKL